MPHEIERKFILSKIPKDLPTLKIKQGYLQLDKNFTIRVESTISSSGTKNTFLFYLFIYKVKIDFISDPCFFRMLFYTLQMILTSTLRCQV